MAYFNQDKKKVLVQQLKEKFPGWKFSLKVIHQSVVVVQIKSAPINLVAEYMATCSPEQREYIDCNSSFQLNHYWLHTYFSGETLSEMQRLMDVINLRDTKYANHNRTDVQADYFDVGYYVNLVLGQGDKPFVYTEAKK